mgnify:CR=1 FL=1|tara:strand:+ start:158 stop:391 length:234 start_codon:yes stop_codon:yes gene_type:complete
MTDLYLSDFIQAQKDDKIYRQKKLENLDYAIDSLIKWKDEHRFCLIGEEVRSLNNVIERLTDTLIDLKDNINNEGKV